MEIEQQYEHKTDAELVQLTLENQDIFSYLVQRYQGKLLRYIVRLSNVDPEEAEDILQDVFIKVYRNLNGFDPTLKFSSWIYRITHNQVISHYRKMKVRPQTASWLFDEDALGKIASDVDLSADIDRQFLQQYVAQGLAQLEPRYREVLVLRFFEQKDYAEISDIMKKPTGTVATLLNRAKKQLQHIIIKQHYGKSAD